MAAREGTKEERQPLRSGAEVKPVYCVPLRSGSIGSANDARLNGSDAPTVSSSSPGSGTYAFLGGWWPFSSRGGGGGGYGGLGGSSAPGARKIRKVPVKVEPKVFFANERTFLAWLNMAVTLSSISIAILAFADHNEFSQIYGFIILPVAICFCVYALRTYVKRSSMLRNRLPGPYEDRIGPIVLTVLLVLSILINMILKIVDIYSPSSLGGKGAGAGGGRVRPINE